MPQDRRPRIRLMIGPGTLTSQGRDRTDFTHYEPRLSGKPRLTGEELAAALPELAAYAEITIDAGNEHLMASAEDLRKLSLAVSAVAGDPDVDGIVWVQGTNTLEETAFFLNLAVRTDKPVVVVGAQRPFTALGTDAPLNLLHGVRVAASPEAGSMGVVVVANGEINAARDVTKTATYQVQTFRSRDLGVLGYVDPDRVVFYRAPLRRHTAASEFDLASIPALPDVEIIYVHTGLLPGLARAAATLGARGLVIAGSGAGAMGRARDVLLELVRHGTVVVRSARVGEGRVLATGNAHEENVIAADNLNPQKAALLLALALTRTSDPAEIQRMFDTY